MRPSSFSTWTSPSTPDLLAEWHDIESREVPSSRENFLYYV